MPQFKLSSKATGQNYACSTLFQSTIQVPCSPAARSTAQGSRSCPRKARARLPAGQKWTLLPLALASKRASIHKFRKTGAPETLMTASASALIKQAVWAQRASLNSSPLGQQHILEVLEHVLVEALNCADISPVTFGMRPANSCQLLSGENQQKRNTSDKRSAWRHQSTESRVKRHPGASRSPGS